MNYYRLKDRKPVPCRVEDWSKFFNTNERIVGQTTIGNAMVSTVFLGIDHSYGDGPPMLFETMIFGGEHDGYQERCSTWVEAEAMHARGEVRVKEGVR